MTLVLEATNEVAKQYMASPWLPEFVAQKFQWHALFLQTVQAAESIVQRNIKPELFNSYFILASRWFSHHDAIEKLLPAGRYGDCMILLRSLLEDTDLMTYFAYYPEDSKEWKQRLGRSPIWSDNEYRQGIQQFRMSNIWSKLKDKDIEPLGQPNQAVLSSTVHASPWGIQFFGRVLPEDPERIHLGLAPTYDPAASFTIGMVLQETYPRPIHAFLVSCENSRVPKSEWRSIKLRFEGLIGEWRAKMDFYALYRTEVAAAVERIVQGEEQEAVFEDLLRRFKEQYASMGHEVE